jgi:hypothetical protein
MVVLNTAEYNQRIPALLEDQAYKKLNMYSWGSRVQECSQKILKVGGLTGILGSPTSTRKGFS